jgi:predicted phage tail protein
MIIAGSGGQQAATGTTTPKTAKDTLNSTQYIQLIDLISEGEIEGFPSARAYTRGTAAYNVAMLKDIFLDGTPILKASANPAAPAAEDYNFQDITIYVRYGTADQTYVPGFESVQTEVSVGVTVSNAVPVSRTITDADTDAVRVTVSFPRLEKYLENGDVRKDEVNWQVHLSYNGGAYFTAARDSVYGRSADPFQRTLTVPLTGAFPVGVRVVRETIDRPSSEKDPSGDRHYDEFSWSSYTELTYAKLSYPHSALLFLQAPASTFTTVPARSYRIRAMKVAVPSNATVNQADGSLTFSGVWNGTFSVPVWTTDPAWQLWDLLTTGRYGTGDHISGNDLDRWAFYSASVYANGRVPTGVGNATEPRFSCHVAIQSSAEAYKAINDLASVFRAMPFWRSGGVSLGQDRPADPSHVFNQTNIGAEGFSYSSSSRTQRHTVAVVSWFDRDQQDLAYEVVEDRDGIARYGAIVASVEGFGCCSQSQARRIGFMLLATENSETDLATFKALASAGVAVRPGMIIATEDQLHSNGARRGGRITGGTTTTVVLDTPVGSLPATTSPVAMVALADGTVASRAVTSASGSTLTLASALPAAPLVAGCYIYSDAFSLWRVLTVGEQNGDEYPITALQYNPDKYDYVERFLPLGRSQLTTTVNRSTRIATAQIRVAPQQLESSYSLVKSTKVGTAQIRVAPQQLESSYSGQRFTRVGSATIRATAQALNSSVT